MTRIKNIDKTKFALTLSILALIPVAAAGCGSATTATVIKTTPAASLGRQGAESETETEKAEPATGYTGWTKGQVGTAIEAAQKGAPQLSGTEAECIAITEIRSYTDAEVAAGLSPAQLAQLNKEALVCLN